jgi:hypothetical protein
VERKNQDYCATWLWEPVRCIVPKTAVPYIKTQLYDYPHIDRTQRHLHSEQPLDIVFIDNGEPNAEYNWLQLPQLLVYQIAYIVVVELTDV